VQSPYFGAYFGSYIMPKLFPFVPKFGFICFGFVSLFSVLNIHYFLFVWLFSMFSDGFCSFCMLTKLVCMLSIVFFWFSFVSFCCSFWFSLFCSFSLFAFYVALNGACNLILALLIEVLREPI
jgi:hypothetical protein